MATSSTLAGTSKSSSSLSAGIEVDISVMDVCLKDDIVFCRFVCILDGALLASLAITLL